MGKACCAYCRGFQQLMKLANHCIRYPIPLLTEGYGCLRELPGLIRREGCRKVLLVTGKHVILLPQVQELLTQMKEKGLPYALFNDLSPNPTSDQVETGVQVYRQMGCDGIVALGGGSSMDCAKAIGARIARPGRSVSRLQGLLKVGRPLPPLFAIPTTAGTGSETTLAAVITDSGTHRKAAINDPRLMPRYALLDPSLTLGLPPFTTAITGMDALCHAVESYTNRTYCTQKELRFAVLAVQLIHDYLPRAFTHGEDPVARGQMLKASFLAGRSFTRGCVGYVHAVGHTLSALYGTPHGLAMAILLPHVLRAYGPAVTEPLAALAHACGLPGVTPEERAENFIVWIESSKAAMGLPEYADMIEDKDIPQIIRWAMKEANPLYPVPVVWGKEEFTALLQRARGL